MRRLLVILCLLLVAAPIPKAQATISIITATHQAGVAAGSVTCTANTTGSKLLFVFVSDYVLAPWGTLTDDQGNTYTQIIRDSNLALNPKSILYRCNLPTNSAALHIHYSNGGLQFPSMEVVACAGTNTVTPFDNVVSSTTSTAGHTTFTVGPLTPAENDEILFSTVQITTGSTARHMNSGFSPLDSTTTPYANALIYYKIQTARHTETPMESWTNTSGYNAQLLVFKAQTPAVYGSRNFLIFLTD